MPRAPERRWRPCQRRVVVLAGSLCDGRGGHRQEGDVGRWTGTALVADTQAAETAHAMAARPVTTGAVASANVEAPAVEAAVHSKTVHAAKSAEAAAKVQRKARHLLVLTLFL